MGLYSLHTDKGKAVRSFILLAAGLYAPVKSQTYRNTCTYVHTQGELQTPRGLIFKGLGIASVWRNIPILNIK